MIDVRDIAQAYWIASEKCEYGTPYNIGGVNPLSVGNFLDILKSKAMVPIKSKLDKSLLRKSDITNQVPDVSKFCKKTEWNPRITLEESVEWLLECCRKVVKNEN